LRAWSTNGPAGRGSRNGAADSGATPEEAFATVDIDTIDLASGLRVLIHDCERRAAGVINLISQRAVPYS
jgi:hypothetical protein